jgi:hypothetical protein
MSMRGRFARLAAILYWAARRWSRADNGALHRTRCRGFRAFWVHFALTFFLAYHNAWRLCWPALPPKPLQLSGISPRLSFPRFQAQLLNPRRQTRLCWRADALTFCLAYHNAWAAMLASVAAEAIAAQWDFPPAFFSKVPGSTPHPPPPNKIVLASRLKKKDVPRRPVVPIMRQQRIC